MALFGRKKKKNAVEETTASEKLEQAIPAKEPKPKKRSRNELLSSVFQESVLSSALSEIRNNPQFDIEYDFGDGKGAVPSHVLLALDTDSIGGISKKTSNDEDRGSIIQSCVSGVMSTFMTEGMLEDNLMSFIPTKETLHNMDEYALLSGATYHPLIINDDAANDVRITVLIDGDDQVDMKLSDAQDILDGRKKIGDFLSSAKAAPADNGVDNLSDLIGDGAIDEPIDVTPYGDDVTAPYESADVDVQLNRPTESAYDASEEFADDYADDIAAPTDFSAIDMALNEQAAAAEVISNEAQGSTFEREETPVAAPEVTQAAPAEQAAVEVSADTFNDIIARNFFKSDLNLEVSLDAFDAHFRNGAPIVEFSEDRGEGWLQEGLAERSRTANVEMRRMHDRHLEQLRQRYIVMAEGLADSVMQKVSLDADSGSDFAEDVAKLEARHKERLDNCDNEIERRRSHLNEDWERDLDRVANEAASRARSSYSLRHSDEHKRELADIQAKVKAEIVDEYMVQNKKLSELRYQRGRSYFERGMTQIFEYLTKEYASMCADEDELYRALRDDMSAWVDENRKDDIAYAEALREEQLQGEKSEAVRLEYMNRMAQQEQDFAVRRQALTEEIDDLKLRQKNWVDEITAQHNNELDALRAKNNELEARCNDLLDRYAMIDETKRQEYEARLEAKDSEIAAEKERYENLQNHNKTISYLWVAVALVALVAAACIGLLLGMNQRLDMQVENMTSANSAISFDWFEDVDDII